MPKFKTIEGSITSPQGFHTAARFCDLKKIGTGKGSNKGEKRDLALIYSETPAKAAGMFTTNQICAAPVKICIKHLKYLMILHIQKFHLKVSMIGIII